MSCHLATGGQDKSVEDPSLAGARMARHDMCDAEALEFAQKLAHHGRLVIVKAQGGFDKGAGPRYHVSPEIRTKTGDIVCPRIALPGIVDADDQRVDGDAGGLQPGLQRLGMGAHVVLAIARDIQRADPAAGMIRQQRGTGADGGAERRARRRGGVE